MKQTDSIYNTFTFYEINNMMKVPSGSRLSPTHHHKNNGTVSPGVYSASNRNEYQKHKNNNVSEESVVGA
jgi:hypothetical protein